MTSPNEYFDEIFCINLNRCHERWDSISKRFKRENIYVTRFEGLDKLDSQIKNDFLQHIKNKQSKIQKVGRYAVFRTFKKLFEYIVTLDVDRILIFEDDILFHKNFASMFENSVRKINPNWRMWYLGSTQVNWKGLDKSKIQDFYSPQGSTFGMFAVGLRKWVIKEFLDRYSLGLKNNDHFFASEMVRSEIYVSYPQLIGHDLGWSFNADYSINESIATKLPYFYYDKDIYF